jgi:hypothetical protein
MPFPFELETEQKVENIGKKKLGGICGNLLVMASDLSIEKSDSDGVRFRHISPVSVIPYICVNGKKRRKTTDNCRSYRKSFILAHVVKEDHVGQLVEDLAIVDWVVLIRCANSACVIPARTRAAISSRAMANSGCCNSYWALTSASFNMRALTSLRLFIIDSQ